MTDCQRMQDTLHNAVIGNRPPLSAIAAAKGDTDKGVTIDELLDHQMLWSRRVKSALERSLIAS
jgi:hypothetical protein